MGFNMLCLRLYLTLVLVCASVAQVIELECKNITAPNPFTCDPVQTCDDYYCMSQNKICCPLSDSKYCGYSCQVGVYKGCYKKHWWCYGPTVSSSAVLPYRFSSPAFYIDNQDGVLGVGHAAQIEYWATRIGMPITFMLLAPADYYQYYYRITAYRVTHTAVYQGLNIVYINWDILQPGLRFAYKVDITGEFPIPYGIGNEGGGLYHSFINPIRVGDMVTVQHSQKIPGGVNLRFQARICLDAEADRVDDYLCGYVTPTPKTTTTTSPTTSTTEPTCVIKKIPIGIGCIGQAAPQFPGDISQHTIGGSYTYIDMTGELRDGDITSIEYHVIHQNPIIFQVWEESPIPSAQFFLRHQFFIVPTAVHQLLVIDLVALNRIMPVRNKWRYGFTYVKFIGNPVVPLQYKVMNIFDGLTDTGRPYLGTECITTGCGVGVPISGKVSMKNRNNQVQKKFMIRPCMTAYKEVCVKKPH